jgi:hypothetical protein
MLRHTQHRVCALTNGSVQSEDREERIIDRTHGRHHVRQGEHLGAVGFVSFEVSHLVTDVWTGRIGHLRSMTERDTPGKRWYSGSSAAGFGVVELGPCEQRLHL